MNAIATAPPSRRPFTNFTSHPGARSPTSPPSPPSRRPFTNFTSHQSIASRPPGQWWRRRQAGMGGIFRKEDIVQALCGGQGGLLAMWLTMPVETVQKMQASSTAPPLPAPCLPTHSTT